MTMEITSTAASPCARPAHRHASPRPSADCYQPTIPDDPGLLPRSVPRVGHPGDAVGAAEDPIPMQLSRDGGWLARLNLSVACEGRPASLLVDCGTARTWLTLPPGNPEWVPDARAVTIGGQPMRALGRTVPPFATPPGEAPVVGAIGNDYLLAGTTVLDLGRGSLTRLPAGALPSGADQWPSIPLEEVRGLIMTQAVVDGRSVHFMVDTGCPHTLLLGQSGRDGDAVEASTDVLGNPLQLALGTAALDLGSGPVAIPAWRIPSFPHLEEIARDTGRRIDGLLGLSAMGEKRVAFDPARGRMYFER